MGSIGVIARCYDKNGKIDRRAEVERECKLIEGYTVIKTMFVGTVAYRAVRIEETGEITADVIETYTKNNEEFIFREDDESVCPYMCNCPKTILDMLTPTDSEWANEWREKCRENLKKKNSPNALKNLPIGSVIRFKTWRGDEMELTKQPASYQFKRPFWMNEDSHKYVSKKHIPSDYEVVKRGVA